MVFNSFQFLIFFPVVAVLYFLVPAKVRYIWLLIASYYFYMSWNVKYALLIALSTVITYASGLLLEKGSIAFDGKKQQIFKKWVVAGSFVTNLGILFFFKYFDFMLSVINRLLVHLGMDLVQSPFHLLLPVGISFYTFQALSYTMDVYRGKIAAEKNLLRYALFVSFFPQLVAGPIERSTSLLGQLKEVHEWKLFQYDRIISGLSMMVWGYFMKMVIADRLAIFVDEVFGNFRDYGAVDLIAGAVCFAFQIYCDFGSYSLIAIGSAKVMGFTLMENFDTPYFSCSIKEFWRRWHISLSTWFRDYLYIPLGGSRRGKRRTYLNVLITFLASGLWHGASFHFIVWGGLHGMYQIAGDLLLPLKQKLAKAWHITKGNVIGRSIDRIVTFVLVDIAWIFFRADSLTDAIAYLKCVALRFHLRDLPSGSLFTHGLSRLEFGIAVCGLLILLAADCVRYQKGMQLDAFLMTKPVLCRFAVYIFLICAILVFGIYGTAYDAAEFIYFQF